MIGDVCAAPRVEQRDAVDRGVSVIAESDVELRYALRALGVEIQRQLPMPVTVNSHNARYLESKRKQSQLELLRATAPQAAASPATLLTGDAR